MDDQVEDGEDGMDGRQLEVPPDQDKQRGEDIARDGHAQSRAGGHQREPAKEAVAAIDFLRVAQAGEQLPDEEGDQDWREDEVHQRVGHEDDTAPNYGQGGAEDRQVEFDAVFQLPRLQTEEQRDEDGLQQPEEGVGELRGDAQHSVAPDEAVDDDGNEDAQQQGEINTLPSGQLVFQRLDITEHGDEEEKGDEPRHHQFDDEQEDDEDLQSVFLGVFLVDVAEGLPPVTLGMLQDGVPWCLPLDEDAVLQHLVVVVGIVVSLLQAQVGLIVMDAIGYHDGLGVGVHHEQPAGIGDTLLAVVLALLVEHERHREGVGQGFDFLVQFDMGYAEEERVQGVVVDEQAVGHADDSVELGREPAERLDEAGVTLDLDVEVADDAVEGSAVLVELVVFLGDLLQGVAHVEGEALFL